VPKKRQMSAAQRRPTAGRTPVPIVGFVALGCVKNLVDSEKMLAQIAESGAIITADESAADTIVVNTCGFLDAARQEALDVLRELAERKRRGSLRRLVVAGCLVQRDGQKLRELVPEIDALVGVHQREDVARAIWPGGGATQADLYLGNFYPRPWSDRGRLRLTPAHYAYVRISEGCNQKCTFCTIPAIRGPLRSKPADELLAECHELIDAGARELILIGQDTTSYGSDREDAVGLADLLRLLDRECAGARWLRLMYTYPSAFSDEMIAAIAECPRVVKYVDLPLQHITDRMLKAMGRRVTRRQTEALLERLRRQIPGVVVRTTFIVGFPGETEADFAELLAFVRDFRFDALGVFRYSSEPDTPAARLPQPCPEEVKTERYQRLMEAQQEVAFAAARQRIGQHFEIVVDQIGPDGACGRHAGQAPEVDGVCRLTGGAPTVGELVPVRCTGAEGYDLLVQAQQQRLPSVPRQREGSKTRARSDANGRLNH